MNQQQEQMAIEQEMSQDSKENSQRLTETNEHIKGIGEYHTA